MKTFGTIQQNEYTVEDLYTSAPISWQLLSGSSGVALDGYEPYLDGAVTIQRASITRGTTAINSDTGTLEYILHKSVKHLFYTNNVFYQNNTLLTSSIVPLPDNFYVISVGQTFYGDRIKPGTFEVTTELASKIILDDGVGNLYVSQSSVGAYVGNIFYDQGLAVIKENTGSLTTDISVDGLKIIGSTEIYVDYSSDVKFTRHEITVKLEPNEFNFSPFNPSITNQYIATGSYTSSVNRFIESMSMQNITPTSGSTAWGLYKLMGDGVIKPYITSIGLYNDKYELLAVAKLNQPIQRTFDTNQIFIVRFDT
jgi:hypothetical protein